MDIAAYRALVVELEAIAGRDPDALRARVYGIIAIGYAYVFAILLLLVGTTVATIAFMVWTQRVLALWKLVAALLAVSGVILQALWVRIDPPVGRPLLPDEAPRLRERVEAIRAALRAPRPSAILLDDNFNASVTSVPQLGIFGLPQTYLTIGVPLMYALSPQQFDAVLAHEFGHLSGAHPKRGLWVYRVGGTWQQLMERMKERRSAALFLFESFFEWFIPKLNAYGFVMSRADEYAADADGARATSPAAMGSALVALAVRGQALNEDIWPGIWARAEREAYPPGDVLRSVPESLRASDVHQARPARIGRALQAGAGDADTHPPLRERMRALGLLPAEVDAASDVGTVDTLLAPLGESAAEYYLGARAAAELEVFNDRWRERAMRDWRGIFQRAETRRNRIAELVAGDAVDAMTSTHLLELMALVAQDQGDAAAEPIALRVLEADNSRAEAHYLLGRVLLRRGDPEGVSRIRRAMELAPDAVMPGAQLLYAYFEAHHDADGAAEMERRFNERRALLDEAKRERSQALPSDEFAFPDLDAATEKAIRDAMRRTSGIHSVIVTRKVVKHGADQPLYVLGIVPTFFSRFRTDESGSAAHNLLAHIATVSPDLLTMGDLPEQRDLAQDLLKRGLAVELRA